MALATEPSQTIPRRIVRIGWLPGMVRQTNTQRSFHTGIARGLDVPGLAVVYNFDCPTHLEDYVHRCGRISRTGNTGTAITLVENPGQDRFVVHVAHAPKGVELPADLLEGGGDLPREGQGRY
jgi:superfamily II DNA/RNA helicase